MPVQDLTPQLRTRLSRVERIVGWFVLLATLLMLSGFGFYIYHTAERKGWLKIKVRYYTLAESAQGLSVGDPVTLMGFQVGQITRIDAQPPDSYFNVYLEFQILEPYYGYLWSEGSHARVSPSDFLGNRSIEVTKGTGGVPSYIQWRIRRLTLEAAQSLTNYQNLVMAQEVARTEAHMVLAISGQPLTVDLASAIQASGITEITVTDRGRTLTNQIAVTEVPALTNLNDLVLAYDVWRPSSQALLVKAMTPLSSDVVDLLTTRGIQEFLIADKSEQENAITAFWDPIAGTYRPYEEQTEPYWLPPEEDPALTERLEMVVSQVESAVPSILNLTNQVAAVLNSTTNVTMRLGTVLQSAQPIVTNVAEITSVLRNPNGSLGEWLIPTNMQGPLLGTLSNASSALASADSTLTTAGTNLATLASSLNLTLINLANITSNLNAQVQTNDQILSEISSAIREADDLMQGLKRHWLLRSAFRTEEKEEPKTPPRRPRVQSPRGRTLP